MSRRGAGVGAAEAAEVGDFAKACKLSLEGRSDADDRWRVEADQLDDAARTACRAWLEHCHKTARPNTTPHMMDLRSTNQRLIAKMNNLADYMASIDALNDLYER